MGNGPSRYPNAEPLYPQTRPGGGNGFFISRSRKRPRAASDGWIPDEGYQTQYPQTRPNVPYPQPQFFNAQQFYPAYGMPPVTVGTLPFAPVTGQPGAAPVVPPPPTVMQAPQGVIPSMAMPAPQPQAGPYGPSDSVFPPPHMMPNNNGPVIPPTMPLAPGQYGPRDSYDSDSSRSRSRTPSPEPQPRYYHRRGRSYDDHYTPRHNPLPAPPRDLFELSPYVSLLQDLKQSPEETTFRKYAPSVPRSVLITPVVAQSQHSTNQGSYSSRERKQKKGIFRSLSSRLAPKNNHHDDIHHTHSQPPAFVPAVTMTPITINAPVGERTPGGGMQYVYNAPLPGVPENPVIPNLGPSSRAATPVVIPNRTPSPMPVPRGATPGPGGVRMPTPVPAPPHILNIEDGGPLSGLLHYSPHPVNFNRKVYPTAYHLWEAFKFMDHRPDIAERIRTTGSGPDGLQAARRLADEMRDAMRLDWGQVAMSLAEEALYTKFVQHPTLRRVLFETGDADLSFQSRDNDFWAESGMGQGPNVLGKALVYVRERLRHDGYTLDM
ncbi:hypothetical protein QCA50_020891 [Cerrena zonata]|uniref:NADAR domain-containing protein n=1 Tax=Cerrena zonata TaxID=2478898 RepID=A0AAW0FFV3_9APHY